MNQRPFIYGVIVALMMTGCGVYHPQTVDIPLIKSKNDLRIDAGVSVMPTIHSTISYGLTKKIAVQAYGSYGSDHQYSQIAAGLYKSYENRLVMELYGGFGAGYGKVYKDANPGHMYGDYQLYFLQYNLGKYSTKSDHFVFGFGLKTGYFQSNLTDENYYAFVSETGPFIKYKENSILLEPMAFIRVGGEIVKFSFKVGVCQIFKLTNPDNYIPVSNVNVGLGISFSPKLKTADIKAKN